MAKLTEFVTPTGTKGNILSPTSWLQMILGVIVFLIAFAIGQNLKDKAASKLPFDTTIDPITAARPPVNNTPAKMVF